MVQMLNDNQIRNISDLALVLPTLRNLDPKSVGSRKERSEWIRERLLRFRYRTLNKQEKGILIEYIRLMTGCGVRTVKRHIKMYAQGKIMCRDYDRRNFPTIYTNADKELLAITDSLHDRLNGKATKNILMAEFLAGDQRYERLAGISCAHLYNLRKSRVYREQVQVQGKTNPVQSSIGERRKPEPNGEPGYIRVDTVHQGDHQDGTKGLYHVNLVDEVTQWQITMAVEAISEFHLIPVLKQALTSFPFSVKNFHSDNGSEYINKTVMKLLNKLLIAQTKSRARKSNDNGLVESKNGSTIRKHLGHWHIPKQFASRLNLFYEKHFIPYLNFYRPCAFPEKKELANGKIKICYPQENFMTPLQKLLSLEKAEQYLKRGITPELLRSEAQKKTPNEAAADMKKAKKEFLAIALQKQDVI